MKSIFIIILLGGVFYLSSCNKDNNTHNLLIIPSVDSVTKGSIFTIYFNNDSFTINDLTVQGSPIEYLYASDTFNTNDSIWMGRILVTDYQLKQISMDMSISDTTDPYNVTTGIYYVTSNNSRLTDYSKGENRTYTIMMGSSVNITRAYSPITGTMSLKLYYNHDTIPATGSFKIYR